MLYFWILKQLKKAMKIKESLRETIQKQQQPFLIAGPCSVETEEQMLQIAEGFNRHHKPQIFRGGIWKPRTRPNSFEGVGAIGLPWLVNAAKHCEIPSATEVANRHHVEAALEAGVSILWIGARTTVNPFAVQEIADAMKGTNIPVMIKNPINPDLELWIGAFERFQKAGLSDLTAIHRGFSVYKHPKYRNVPNWEIALAFRQRMPEIPMICDPSHITGNRSLLLEVSQKAVDLNMDGWMIETHNNPDKAWSDSAQQITTEQLQLLLRQLVLRHPELPNDLMPGLNELREKIAVLDDRLFDILSARMKCSEEVGQFKRENNITIYQQEHWARMIAGRLAKSEDYDLSLYFIRQLMDAIHQESIRHQTRVMNPQRGGLI